MLQTPQGGSNLAAQRRFNNFWSNVSRIRIGELVSENTVNAIGAALAATQPVLVDQSQS